MMLDYVTLCNPLNCRFFNMDATGTSSDNNDFTNCDDIKDSDLEVSDDDDDDPNLNSQLRKELECLRLCMFELVQECYRHLMHSSISHISIPQKTSQLTSAMWVHWVLTDINKNTCYKRFWMGLNTFLKLCNTLKHNELLKSSRYVKIMEQVTTFLLVVTQCHTHRDVLDIVAKGRGLKGGIYLKNLIIAFVKKFMPPFSHE
jgi:hypothetical protein